MCSEILQDSTLELFDSGKLAFASGSSITLGAEAHDRVIPNIDRYKNKVVLRPQEISNHPEVIRRLGVIGINTALECDIYGNVNSAHVNGTHMMNGIGGSGDFARNAYLAIFVTKSLAKNGALSRVVPMVTHVDHNEHDVDVIATEIGLADLRGLAPRERAETIIRNCTSIRLIVNWPPITCVGLFSTEDIRLTFRKRPFPGTFVPNRRALCCRLK